MAAEITRLPIQFEDKLENLVTGQGGPADSRNPNARRFIYVRRSLQDLQEMYRSNWLAGQVVEINAFEMTRERRVFTIEDQELADHLTAESERLLYWEKVREAIQWADLFGGGAILLGVDGMGEVDEPLEVENIKEGSLKFIHSLDAKTIFPQAGIDTHLVMDPTSENFMLPEFYSIASARMDFIHHSRIIRFNGLPLPWLEMQRTLWWGGSRLERMLDTLADAEQVIGGIAELIDEAKIDVYGIKGLMQMLSTPEGETRVVKRIEVADRLKSIRHAIIIDAEETYDQKQNAIVQGMSQIIEQYLAIVSAAAGIPVTRLLGTSAQGLSATGEGDLRNFYDMISSRRENYLRPRLNKLDEVFMRSAGVSEPGDIQWDFGSLWQMDDAAVAEIQTKRASRDQVYLNSGVIDEIVIAKQLKVDGTYVAIDDEYITELELEVEELKAAALEGDPFGGGNQDPNSDDDDDDDDDDDGNGDK